MKTIALFSMVLTGALLLQQPAFAEGKQAGKEPELVLSIRKAYQQAQEDKKKDESVSMNLRMGKRQHEDIQFYFKDEGAQSAYFITVKGEDNYEEYLVDTQQDPPFLRFWFQKHTEGNKTREMRLYFDGNAVVYHNVQEKTGKDGKVTVIKGEGVPPDDFWEDSISGNYVMQRSLQALDSLFDSWMMYTFYL